MAHSELYKRLMNSTEWRRLRMEYLSSHPLCELCKRKDIITPARCIHHITPIESGRTDAQCKELAFSRANLQALCFACHSAIHKGEHSHSKEAHKQRTNDRLQQWLNKHTQQHKSKSKMKVKIKLNHPDAVLPRKAHDTDAAADLTAVSIEHDKENNTYVADFGFSMEIPEGYVGLIFPRSSICNTGFALSNSVGVIDAGYRGPVKAKFYDITFEGNGYADGERCAQLMILPIPAVEYEETTDALSDSARGAGGYGSTGK